MWARSDSIDGQDLEDEASSIEQFLPESVYQRFPEPALHMDLGKVVHKTDTVAPL